MIRLGLFILVICISGLTGVTENKKVLFSNQPQLGQSEISPEIKLAENSVLFFGIIETNANEPNPLINNHKHFSLSDQFNI
jgi:hypothetical protein